MPTLQERHCARVSGSKKQMSGTGDMQTVPSHPKSWTCPFSGSHLGHGGCGKGLGPLSDVFRHESYSSLKQISDSQVYTASPGWAEGKREQDSLFPCSPSPFTTHFPSLCLSPYVSLPFLIPRSLWMTPSGTWGKTSFTL